jgi:hypothetical protein
MDSSPAIDIMKSTNSVGGYDHQVVSTQDPDYYFDDGNCVVRVEDTLFRVSVSTC